MKKILKSVFAIAIATLAFTSCDDVPQPYDNLTVNTGGTTFEGAAGEGTQTAPYNVAGVLQYISTLEAGVESEQDVYIEGVVSAITEEYTTQFGNGTFDITDEGSTNTFTVYRALYVGNKKFAAGDQQIAVGDKVVVCGRVVNYRGNTPETAQGKAYLVSINGEGGTGSQPTGETIGTADAPLTTAQAVEMINAMANGEKSADKAYVKGKVVKVATNAENFAKYGNLNYYISDDGTSTNQVQIYAGDGLNGAKFSSINDIKAGDEVVVLGTLYKYVNKSDAVVPEITDSYIVKLTGGSGEVTPTPQPTGSNLLANGNFESWTNGLPDNWKPTSTAGNATLSQSTNAHGGSYAVLVSKATQNKRMAYKEITLKAGTYVESFYVRAADASAKASVRPGYVPVTDKVGSYAYGDYVNDITGEWQQVSHEFTLSDETKVCVLVMLPSNSGSDVIIDDFTLTTANGGLADGSGNTPDPTPAGGLSYDFKANGQSGWNIVDTNLPSGLTYIWSYDDRYGMKASAYANNTNYASESWLISPALDLSNLSTATLKISHAGNYFGGAVSDDCSVMVSTNYSSGNPSSATWTKLNVSAWPTSWTFVNATASLASVAGKSNVRIAFKYTSPASKAGTWEISTASIQ